MFEDFSAHGKKDLTFIVIVELPFISLYSTFYFFAFRSMVKLLLLFFLVPLFLSVFLKKLFFRPSVELQGLRAQLSVQSVLGSLLPSSIVLQSGKSVDFKGGTLYLPVSLAKSRSLQDHIEPLTTFGLICLSSKRFNRVRQHQSLLTFDVLFPVFSFLILVFGVLAKALPLSVAASLLVVSLGITALSNLYLTWLRYQAVKICLLKLKQVDFYTRSEDLNFFKAQLNSNCYRFVVPKLISWML